VQICGVSLTLLYLPHTRVLWKQGNSGLVWLFGLWYWRQAGKVGRVDFCKMLVVAVGAAGRRVITVAALWIQSLWKFWTVTAATCYSTSNAILQAGHQYKGHHCSIQVWFSTQEDYVTNLFSRADNSLFRKKETM
jgi:hypothetical protein